MTITLATLPEATEQEVFDQVATHLITQGKKSLNTSETSCMYKGIENTKCAAGCLIAENEYRTSMEGGYWNGLVDKKAVPKEHQFLIGGLQIIHDGLTPDNWKTNLIKFAKERNLELPEILQQ